MTCAQDREHELAIVTNNAMRFRKRPRAFTTGTRHKAHAVPLNYRLPSIHTDLRPVLLKSRNRALHKQEAPNPENEHMQLAAVTSNGT